MFNALKSKDELDDEQLLRICNYGADLQRKDQNLIPRFSIAPCEIGKVKAYMAAKHPDVRYQIEYPGPHKY